MDASNSGLAHGTSGSPQTTIENKEAEQKAIENEERIKAELEAKREAEEKAKREAEEKAKREAEEKVKREAEEQAKREAEEKKKKEAEEQAKREAEEKAIREAITSKIWNKIEPTQEVYPGTDLPRSFNIETVQGQMWVHGNATEHIKETIRSTKEYPRLKFSNQKLYLQFLLHEFHKALNIAVQNGIEYTENEIIVGNWKFRFSKPRKGFKNSVVIHAVFTGFEGGLEQ